MIRLSTSCRSWLCRDTPTLCSRNKPIPFLYFQGTLRMYLYLCVCVFILKERMMDSTCSIGQERQQLEDTKPPGERGQPRYIILFCLKKILLHRRDIGEKFEESVTCLQLAESSSMYRDAGAGCLIVINFHHLLIL